MTETLQTPATIVRDQLAELLVIVPLSVCEAMTDRDKFRVLDWCETASQQVARQDFVPIPEVRAIRDHMTEMQLNGAWRAFTNWRPGKPLPHQKTLFND